VSVPESFWHRLLRKIDDKLDAGEDEDREGDDAMLSFHLLFIVPILLLLVMLMRR
jgi:hypothetical protein